MRRCAVFRSIRWADGGRFCGRPIGACHGFRGRADLRWTLQSGGDLRNGGGAAFPNGRALPYIITQLIGGALASFVFYLVLKGAPADGKWNTFTAASNLYGGAGFSLGAVFLTEAVITALFLVVIVSVTTRNCPAGFAPIAIGLSLTLFHLIAIPISNASLNPARSTATALFGGSEALGSLWLFWVAPIFGGVVGGIIGRWLHQE